MLKQIEGSRAIAESIALCRPEVICAYPITPQTHIVEGLGEMVSTGELEHCEFINVESEFAAMSVAIGASAAGARAYTATASQGLLFMAEAVYNASGLGLPIVMTLGNRAIGAPINIWNDHSDAMSMRDAGWIQLFAETNQEAVDLHIQAFRLAEELSMPVMVCVDGFILTHAFERVDIPEQADGGCVPAAVRSGADARSGRARCRSARWSARRHSPRCAISRTTSRTWRCACFPSSPPSSDALRPRSRAGCLRTYRAEDAETLVVAMGSVNGTIKDTVDEMRDRRLRDRRRRRSCRSARCRPRRCARRSRRAKRVVVIEKSLAVGMGGQLANNVDLALRNTPARRRCMRSIAGLGGRPITGRRCTGCSDAPSGSRGRAAHFLDLNETIVAKELAARAQGAPLRPDRREHPARLWRERAAPAVELKEDAMNDIVTVPAARRSASTRRAPSPSATACFPSTSARCRRRSTAPTRSPAATAPARAAARRSARATRSTRRCERPTASSSPSTRPAASKCSRRRTPRPPGRSPGSIRCSATPPRWPPASPRRCASRDGTDVRVIAQGGDGGTTDIGFGCLSGMFERNDDVLYICYDNEAYMNTGVQRSSATPPAARTATTPAVGTEPGNVFGTARTCRRSRWPTAFRTSRPRPSPICTTSSARSSRRWAFTARATSTSTCRVRSAGARLRTTPIRLARLAVESGLFPVFEAEHGEVTEQPQDPTPSAGRGVSASRRSASRTCSHPS